MDASVLSRLQFGFTIAFHILFPSFTIGLASWLAVVEWRWLRTGNKVYENATPLSFCINIQYLIKNKLFVLVSLKIKYSNIQPIENKSVI